MLTFMTNTSALRKAGGREVFTEQQRLTLIAVRDLSRVRQMPPTYAEVAEALSVSKSTARQTLERLMRKGLMQRSPSRYRNVKVTPAGHGAIRAKKGGR